MVRKIGHISISDTPCHAPMRLMDIINRNKSGGHTCTLALCYLTSVEWMQGQGCHREVGNMFNARKWLYTSRK